MSKQNLVSESIILAKAEEIRRDTVAMIETNNLAINKLEHSFLKFDLMLLKIDKSIYDLQREIAGTQRVLGRHLIDYPSKKKTARNRRPPATFSREAKNILRNGQR